MKNVKNILGFLRLLDENGQLSLTNISVMVMLVKVALLEDFTMTEVSVLLTTLGGYNYKKYLSTKKKTPIEDIEGTNLKLVMDKISKLELRSGFGR